MMNYELVFLRVAVAVLAIVGSVGIFSSPSSSSTAKNYDGSGVNWTELRTDLRALVATCECSPILVRLSWHDAGTFDKSDGSGGARGAQRFPDGEAAHKANAGLQLARSLLAPYREKHPAVSHADLWALAAAVAIEHAGGPKIPFRAGRRDIASASECVSSGRLPDGDKGAKHIRSIFYRQGFTDTDIVALSGAHTIGRCHADRSGFEGAWTENPLTFDNSYFKLLLQCDWKRSKAPTTGQPQLACESHPNAMMLSTDHALATDSKFRQDVERYASDVKAFHRDFAAAFQRLQENGHTRLRTVL